jgi:hypothetical protein
MAPKAERVGCGCCHGGWRICGSSVLGILGGRARRATSFPNRNKYDQYAMTNWLSSESFKNESSDQKAAKDSSTPD